MKIPKKLIGGLLIAVSVLALITGLQFLVQSDVMAILMFAFNVSGVKLPFFMLLFILALSLWTVMFGYFGILLVRNKVNGKNTAAFIITILCSGLLAFFAVYELSATKLMAAIRSDRSPAYIEKMIDEGADVNKNKNGYTPIMFAVLGNKPEIVRLLINKGADVNVRLGDASLLMLTFASGESISPDIVQMLVNAGADVNFKDSEGGSALLMSTYHEYDISIMRILLNAGADPNIVSDSGATPLLTASMVGNLSMVNMLLDKGADINMTNKGKNALYMAAIGQSPDKPEIMKVLIKRGINVNAASDSGETPLMGAARYAGSDIVKLLIGSGADIKAKDKDGRTVADYLKESSRISGEDKEGLEKILTGK